MQSKRLTFGLFVMSGVAAWMAPSLMPSGNEGLVEVARGPVADTVRPCAPAGSATVDRPHAVCGAVHGGAGAQPVDLVVRCTDDYWNPLSIDADGRFSGWVGETCELAAYRRSGALLAPGSSVVVQGPEDDVRLWVPDYEPAGLGFAIDDRRSGLFVGQVHADTPAARAGLETGWRIVAVDYEPTFGMSSWDYIARGLGPAGSEVVLTVVDEDGQNRQNVRIRREHIPALH
jgi:hypothetical protein